MQKGLNNRKVKILCLGDSYTIGEGVDLKETFIYQFINISKKNEHLSFDKPKIIAKTGWTTDELISSIKKRKLLPSYDMVTLLVGVNNQYRNYDLETYKKEFINLVEFALKKTKNKEKHVFIISIPDWGHTPFQSQDKHKRSITEISKQIDSFNLANKKIATKYNLNYINITKISRMAKSNPDLTTIDLLHPSAKMYQLWSQLLHKKFNTNYEF